MKLKRKLATAILFTMLVPFLQPATTTYAAPKTFTYAEQETGIPVNSLTLKPGEKVDLKFIGISDYKNYKLSWESSDETVASVDSYGVIKAKSEGKATITLSVGDGTAYTSAGVSVTVGKRNAISLGTSSANTFSSAELVLGTTMDLNFYGIEDWNSSRYQCSWISTNPQVATVDQKGVITPLTKGTTFIILLVTDKLTSTSLEVTPVSLAVVETASPTMAPKATATPAPTLLPGATTTPVPTLAPGVTATPTPTLAPGITATPTPTLVPGSYNVSVQSTDSILVKFPSGVSYNTDDIKLFHISGSYKSECSFTISWNAEKTEAVLTLTSSFSNKERYRVQFGSNDEGTEFLVEFGEPNRIEIVYECMGKEGIAYAQGSNSVDMPVTLGYRLYYNTIDVTDYYGNYGYVTFELLPTKDQDSVSFYGDELHFYEANKTAVVRATLSYTKNGKDYTLRSENTSITSKSTGTYSVRIEKWSIVDDTDYTINWDNPVHTITANSSGYRLALLLTDSFGIQYSTEDIGVKEYNGIYSIEDSSKFFGGNNYSLEFSSSNEDVCFVAGDGSLSVYDEAKKATISVSLENYSDYNYRTRRIGSVSLQIQAAPKLANIKAEQTSVTLATECLDHPERFSKAEVKIQLLDQYGNEWDGVADLEVSSSTAALKDVVGSSGSPAYISGNTLYIDAEAILAVSEKLSSASFTVTEPNIKRSTTVRVTLTKPSTDKDGNVIVSAWKVGTEDVKLSFDDNFSAESPVISSRVELLRLSKNIPVGLYDNIVYTETTSYRPTESEYSDGKAFVMVIGPNNKAVPTASSSTDVGVYTDTANGCILVNVAGISGGDIEYLAAGKYKVKAILVTWNEQRGAYTTVTKEASFTVTGQKDTVSFQNAKSTKTSTYVSDKDDLSGIAAIVEELFVFKKNGKALTVTADMVASAEVTWRDKSVTIRSLELRIPIGNSGYSYIETVKGINKTIYYGVY